MSYVDLMANDVWSLQDIDRRTQALIRSKVTQEDEFKASRLARKVDASQADLDFVAFVDGVIADVLSQATQARADSALLSETLKYEAAEARLAQYQLSVGKPAEPTDIQQTDENGLPVFDADGNPVMVMTEAIPPITEFVLDADGNPTEEPNPDWPRVAQDDVERAEAQQIVDNAAPEAVALAAQRKGA